MENHNENTGSAVIHRRDFIRGAGTALLVPFSVTLSGRAAMAAEAPVSLGAYISIAPSNIVTVSLGSTEMGQGILTGLSQLVAEELNLSWDQVRAEHAPPGPAYANPLFGWQLTGGSTSMMGWYGPLRKAAAIARDWLIAAANTQFGGTWSLASGGQLTNGSATCLFADVLQTAAGLTPPTNATLATTSNFIGKAKTRLDIPSKVDGSAIFGMDVRVPGMMHATVLHCPTLGGTVKSMPASKSGATLVNLGNAVGVVANDTWTAMKVANSLGTSVVWNLPANLNVIDSAKLLATAQTLAKSPTATTFVAETVGSPAPLTAARKIDVIYNLPFLAHACMEVLNCTASVTPSSCEIWVPTQGQQFIIPTAQAITGLSADQITVHTTFLGGGFGRKIEADYVAQAINISKAIGKPVKLTWSRKQDFQNDKYRPCSTMRVQAGLDANGGISGLIYRNVSPSISLQRGQVSSANPEDSGAVAGAINLPYAMAARRIEYVPLPTDIPLGYWRSVGESYNTFAVESAIDELALAAGKDGMAFRKTLLTGGDARALGVLTAVETLSGWAKAPATGNARGVAFLKGFGSYIAMVAEVSLDSSKKIKVNKVFVAIDCGIAVNPDSIEAQLQGGIAHGLTAAMWNQVTFAQGKPSVSNFDRYPVLKLRQMPLISVKIVESNAAPGGVGETGVPCVAPAVANAYAKLTKIRLRTLPFYPGVTMGDD